MINAIQNSFSIQDLELLSGIKAHTIRIWEKRFEILNPKRLNRNIRLYSISDLQKLLNISLLQKSNYKISEISQFSTNEIESKIKEISSNDFSNDYYINSLIVSMFSLDESTFEETYLAQIKKLSFKDIYIQTYIPLLSYIGILWQTNRIKPVQEHFISNLIYQKILLNTALIPQVKTKSKRVNILFLPKGEFHEISLLFMAYHLKLIGEKTIYLGRDIPMNDLLDMNAGFDEINWICYFLIDRTLDEKNEFFSEIEKLLSNTSNTCNIVGKTWKSFSKPKENIFVYEGFDQLIKVCSK